MYSTTYASPEEFERLNGAPRVHVLAAVPSGEREIDDCVHPDEQVIDDLQASALAATSPAPASRARVVTCAAAVGATAVRVVADQRFFDWERGRTGYRFRDRVIATWPVP